MISIDTLSLFLLISLTVGMYLNYVVFDKLIGRIECIHSNMHRIDDFLGNLTRVDDAEEAAEQKKLWEDNY